MLKNIPERIPIKSSEETHMPIIKSRPNDNKNNLSEKPLTIDLNSLNNQNIIPETDYSVNWSIYNKELPLPPPNKKSISIDTSQEGNFDSYSVSQPNTTNQNLKNEEKNLVPEFNKLNTQITMESQTNEIAQGDFPKSVIDNKVFNHHRAKTINESIGDEIEASARSSIKFQENANLNKGYLIMKNKPLPNIPEGARKLINNRMEKNDHVIIKNIERKRLEKTKLEIYKKNNHSPAIKKRNESVFPDSDDNKPLKFTNNEKSKTEMNDINAKSSEIGKINQKEIEKNQKKEKNNHTKISTYTDSEDSGDDKKIKNGKRYKPKMSYSLVSSTSDSDDYGMNDENRKYTKIKNQKRQTSEVPNLKDSKKSETTKKQINVINQNGISIENPIPFDSADFNNFEVKKSLGKPTMTYSRKLKMSEYKDLYRNACRPGTNNASGNINNSIIDSYTQENQLVSSSSCEKNVVIDDCNDVKFNIQSAPTPNSNQIKNIIERFQQFYPKHLDNQNKKMVFNLIKKKTKVISTNLLQNENKYKLPILCHKDLQGPPREESTVKTTITTAELLALLKNEKTFTKNIPGKKNISKVVPKPHNNAYYSTFSAPKKDFGKRANDF